MNSKRWVRITCLILAGLMLATLVGSIGMQLLYYI